MIAVTAFDVRPADGARARHAAHAAAASAAAHKRIAAATDPSVDRGSP